MDYIGEHTLVGQLGHLFISISFVASLFASFGFLMANKQTSSNNYWANIAAKLFFLHLATVLFFVSIMFYMLIKHYYEYDYVWKHSNNEMSMRYVFVCFWGGQQGSFMLWIFWHAILSGILYIRVKNSQPLVFMTIMLVQAFLLSMLLGIYIGKIKIGMSPFALQRDTIEGLGSLWSKIPDYLQLDSRFQNGQGLNPLLQNYWMTIHPPTLFLGFALTLIPFAYAIAALIKKEYNAWIKPALPWAFAAVGVLGIGILMGGMWAYESLSFGGFWAWDPVENASLVPWLTLVGGAHAMLANKNNGKSVYTTILLILITFILVLYSSFLTRSGVLGDTSVHSFTGDGLILQLLFMLLFFTWLVVHSLLIKKHRKIIFTIICFAILVALSLIPDVSKELFKDKDFILTIRGLITLLFFFFCILFMVTDYIECFPKAKNEEALWSREFWMFIGTLVLLLSSIQIIITTSVPVINLLFETKIARVAQEERNWYYNNWQLPFAIIVTLLIAVTQFFKYKDTSVKQFIKNIAYPFLLSLIISIVLVYFIGFTSKAFDVKLSILLFASVFAITANTTYWVKFLKGKLNFAGSSVAHAGFALIMLGTLISQSKQEVISVNKDGFVLNGLGKEFSNTGDIQLFKNDTVKMGNYFVSFNRKFKEDNFLKYEIEYFDKLPRTYSAGDIVKYKSLIYRCKQNHTATQNFLQDISNWEILINPGRTQYFTAKNWDCEKPGKKLFNLYPFIQLSSTNNNVPEPGTKHFWNFDIFTHVRFADLSPEDKDIMEPYSVSAKIGDTLRTAGFNMIYRGITKPTDSIIQKYGIDTAQSLSAQIHLSAYHWADMTFDYEIPLSPLYVLSNDKVFSIPDSTSELGLSFKIKKIEPKKDTVLLSGKLIERDVTEISLGVESKSFIVLKAIKFPYINVLWIGCVIMTLGTLMAVFYRIKLLKRQ